MALYSLIQTVEDSSDSCMPIQLQRFVEEVVFRRPFLPILLTGT